MNHETFDAVILGSGPAGLAAGYRLAQAGKSIVILEKADVAGGLMRSIRRGDYCVDIGRKELYNRFSEVHSLWTELLGSEYRTYPHRLGVLYGSNIIERSRLYRGYRRGIPWSLLLPATADFLIQKAKNVAQPAEPRNEEEYWYRIRGRTFSVVLSQGYKEKFGGFRWRERPPPQGGATGLPLLRRATVKDFNRAEWRHPNYGTGQITEALEKRILSLGGKFVFNAEYETLASDGARVHAVRANVAGVQREWGARSVISTLRLGALAKLLALRAPEEPVVEASKKRSTVIVYLFIDESPRFEHCWLDVTDPDTVIGRVTNYSGFGGSMVPRGKTCLAAEIFTVGPDPILKMKDAEVLDVVERDLARAGLINPSKVSDHLVMKFPGAYAANDYRTWLEPGVLRLLSELKPLTNLYDTHRAGTDVATFAGLMAADAVLRDDRTDYDIRADPTKPLGIESTRLDR